jgi:HEAT repeat protein
MKRRTFLIVLLVIGLNPRLILPEPGVTRAAQTELTAERRAAFRSAKAVRIAVEQSYGFVRGVSLPFDLIVRRLFGYAGLRVATAPGEGPEIEVKIRAVGDAESSQFRDILGQGPAVTLYTKATLEGEITLAGPAQSSYARSFRGRHSVGNLILEKKGTSAYRDRSGAPYQEAFDAEESFVATLLNLIRDIYGLPPLAAALKDESDAIRQHAIGALATTNDPAAVEPLIGSLRDAVPNVRKAAARALGLLGDTRAIEPLVTAMGDQETSVGWEAGAALGKIADPRASQAAVAALQSSSGKHTRLYAALALKQRKDPATIEALTVALEYPDGDIRMMALEALSAFNDPRVVDVFIRMAKNSDTWLRRQAVMTLARIRETRTVEPLLEAVRDSDTDIREMAIKELGERKEQKAIPALVGALSDQNWGVRMNATSALGKITGQTFGDDVKKWQRWWEKQKKN